MKEADKLPRSGISYKLDLDYALAAQWWGHKEMDTFRQLPECEQAYLVAVYRANSNINNVVAYHQAKDARAAAERANK